MVNLAKLAMKGVFIFMNLRDYLTEQLEDKEITSATKVFIRLANDDEEALMFASVADVLDSEHAWLGNDYSHTDRDDNGILNVYIED